MPRSTNFKFTFVVDGQDSWGEDIFNMNEYHDWNSQNIPADPTNIGLVKEFGDFVQYKGTTYEKNVAPGWTVKNLWKFLIYPPKPTRVQFSLITIVTVPPGLPFPAPTVVTVQGTIDRI
jgi:hypothetical protein